MSMIIYEFNLVGVAKVRLGVCETLDSFAQLLLVELGAIFKDLF
jgi:hypothetical protein